MVVETSSSPHSVLRSLISHISGSCPLRAHPSLVALPSPLSIDDCVPILSPNLAPFHAHHLYCFPVLDMALLSISKTNTSTQQIVDGYKNFTTDLAIFLETWGFLDLGFKYDVVSIFGSQSTGKSTLLNALFGTTFGVMDGAQRQQTTRGIWMSPAKDAPILVMDVEGTDSRERGEDLDFERRAALFSLASTEVLIINLWENQVGLYQGASMGLLKTIFEINLLLSGNNTSSPRTLLLFIIRDHVGITPLSDLQTTLVVSLTKMWDSISKPNGRTQSKLGDYFDMSFVGLAHKIFRPDQFQEDVAQLRGRFTDRSREDFIFQPAYHKRIPADGFARYMGDVWERVQGNKDLDLPTQRELLAQFRCDEIIVGVLEEFSAQEKPFRKPIEVGQIVEGLGEKMRSWKDMALARFDTSASRYHQGVYTLYRERLISQLNNSLSILFLNQIKNLGHQVVGRFKEALVGGVPISGDYDFGAILVKARKNAQSSFETQARECTGLGPSSITEKPNDDQQPVDPDWTYEEELCQLMHQIDVFADQFKKEQVKKMIDASEGALATEISGSVEALLSEAKPDMWDRILQAYKESLTTCEVMYLTQSKCFNNTKDETTEWIDVLRKRAWIVLRSKVIKQTTEAFIVQKLQKCFEKQFRYDENGGPKVWRSNNEIDRAFARARDDTLQLVRFYATICPTDSLRDTMLELSASVSGVGPDFSLDMNVLSETQQKAIESRFRLEADAFHVEAKQSIERLEALHVEAKQSIHSTWARLSVWIYDVMLVLGHNEIIFILFSPLYITLPLAGLAVSYAVFKSGPRKLLEQVGQLGLPWRAAAVFVTLILIGLATSYAAMKLDPAMLLIQDPRPRLSGWSTVVLNTLYFTLLLGSLATSYIVIHSSQLRLLRLVLPEPPVDSISAVCIFALYPTFLWSFETSYAILRLGLTRLLLQVSLFELSWRSTMVLGILHFTFLLVGIAVSYIVIQLTAIRLMKPITQADNSIIVSIALHFAIMLCLKASYVGLRFVPTILMHGLPQAGGIDEAKQSITSTWASTPAWIYAVMLALGQTKIMAVPLYITLLLVGSAVSYIVFKLGPRKLLEPVRQLEPPWRIAILFVTLLLAGLAGRYMAMKSDLIGPLIQFPQPGLWNTIMSNAVYFILLLGSLTTNYAVMYWSQIRLLCPVYSEGNPESAACIFVMYSTLLLGLETSYTILKLGLTKLLLQVILIGISWENTIMLDILHLTLFLAGLAVGYAVVHLIVIRLLEPTALPATPIEASITVQFTSLLFFKASYTALMVVLTILSMWIYATSQNEIMTVQFMTIQVRPV
ncbi:Dynamin-like GTPase that mediates homotypic ER fusion [Tulasnella sp. JGI-2019a]|nr:Dynamin-like GTPase that mediates homotypic ER fusion [Tulasnella sp. JGI-2019a]